jgi:hypothetical protein
MRKEKRLVLKFVYGASWLSSNASDLYLGGAQFEFGPEQTAMTIFP